MDVPVVHERNGLRARQVVLGLLAAGLSTIAVAGSAQAAPPHHRIAQDRATPIETIIERAKPALVPKAPAGDGDARTRQAPDGPPVVVEGTEPRRPLVPGDESRLKRASSGAYWPGAYNANPNLQTGKLFYWTGSAWNVCSGTAINSSTKSLVMTAGHCVYDTIKNRWMSNFRFCPGYQFSCPLGVWTATSAGTTTTWANSTSSSYNWRDDVGMIKIARDSSRGYLVNYVGAQGVTFNQSAGLYRTALGYPVKDSRWPQYNWNGEDLVYCQNYGTYDNDGHVNIPCTMTGGASGGPWLVNVGSNWLGYVNGVNSHKPTATTMGSPHFNNMELQLYDFWKNR
jgi:V8-like Glu-specific endopeptidase